MTAPEFILKSNIDAVKPAYRWDDRGHPNPGDGAFSQAIKNLHQLSVRANLALAVMSGEWMNFRFFGEKGDPQFNLLIEALWLAIENPAFLKKESRLCPEKDRGDRIDGALYSYSLAMIDLFRAGITMDGVTHDADGVFRLVDYIMPKPAYKNWRLKAITDLKTFATEPAFPQGRDLLERREELWTPIEKVWGEVLDRDYFITGERKLRPAENNLLPRVKDNPFLHNEPREELPLANTYSYKAIEAQGLRDKVLNW